MSFTLFAPYLRPEFPKFTNSESQIGNEYQYRYPQSAGLNTPLVGEIWADGRSVTDVKHTPALDNSGFDELSLSTVYSRTSGSTGAPAQLEETRVSVRGQVSQVELTRHPAFLPGGTSDLYTGTVTSGGYTETPLWFAMHWENEPNPLVKANRQFYVRDPEGFPLSATPVSVPAGGAMAYVKLRQLGYDTKDEHYAVFTKTSIYRGDDPPVTSTWGQYAASSSLTSLGCPPSVATDYPQSIKVGDDVDKQGNAARWQRNEVWHLFKKVYFDVDTLNPAGDAFLP